MKARLVEWRQIGPITRHYVFEIAQGDQLVYEPGQFMLLSAQIAGQTVMSAYSIAGASEGNRFEFCMNSVPNGKFSPHVFALLPGDEVEVIGPVGTLVWQGRRDAVLVATGSGVAPFRGMLRNRLPLDRDHNYHLIFGARHEHGLLYREEFEEMQRAQPNFRYQPTLTDPPLHWTGSTGRVQSHLLAAVGDRRDLDVYVCGRRDMVEAVRHLLLEIGFDHSQIVTEKAQLTDYLQQHAQLSW